MSLPLIRYTVKKTVQLIVDSGNDYVIAVKGNQKRLYEQIQLTSEQATPLSVLCYIISTIFNSTGRGKQVEAKARESCALGAVVLRVYSDV